MQVDERVEVGERVGRFDELDGTGRLGATDLAPDLVAFLLAERREVRLEVGALGQPDDGADVFALDVERPALGHLAPAERRGERVGRRIRLAEPAQVDDLPGLGMARVDGEVGDDCLSGRGHVRWVPEQRCVVGVVAGTEVHRAGIGRDRGQRQRVGVADRRTGLGVGRLDDVAMHQRRDHNRGARGRGRIDDDHGLVVRGVAVGVPPGAMEGPRREGRRVRVQEGALVPGLLVDGVERSELGAELPIRSRGRSVAGRRVADRARTVGVSLERGGHANEDTSISRFPCARNLIPARSPRRSRTPSQVTASSATQNAIG